MTKEQQIVFLEALKRQQDLLESILQELRNNPRTPKIGVVTGDNQSFTVDQAPIRG